MDNPLVSVVIGCHNRRVYLQKTLESVFAQHYAPIEIIVIDDGSDDGTDKMISGYGDRVRYCWQEPQGIAVARTKASRLAQGEYIAYQDDDDLMPAHRITHLYNALKQYPEAIFATGDYALIDPQGNLTGHRWLSGDLKETAPPRLIEDGHAAVLWPRVPAVPHTTLFRKEYGEKVGWFDHEFKYACSDADFLARLGLMGPIVYLREVVSYYRRGHSAIWNDDLRANYSRLQLWDKHLGLIRGNGKDLRNRLRKRIYMALRRISSCKGRGVVFSDPEYDEFFRRGLAHLRLHDRIFYQLYASLGLPVKKSLKKYI